MKAALLTALQQLEVAEVETPRAGPGDVIVQVKACGVCGSDLRTFRYGHAHVTFPAILGHEFVGVVSEVGEGVQGLLPGNHVIASPAVPCGHCLECVAGRYNRCDHLLSIGEDLPGGFAQYVRLPAQAVSRGSVLPVSPALSLEAATLVEPLSCVLNGQELVDVGIGDTVVVIGLGTIGCMHLVLARLRGARRLIGVERERVRLEVAQCFHADLYVHAQEQDPVAAVLEATGGRGAEVVIVACSSHEAQQQALAMAAKGGRVSLFGGLPKDNPMVLLNTNLIHYRELLVVGAFGAPFPILYKAAELVANGAIPADLFISGRFPLEKIREAFDMAAQAHSLRVIVLP
jgi:L-iditol 2-dehydrogenase